MTSTEVEVKLLRRFVLHGPKWVPGAIMTVPFETATIMVKKGSAVIYTSELKAKDEEHAKALAAVEAEKVAASAAKDATAEEAEKQRAEATASARRVPTAAGQQRRDEIKAEKPDVKRTPQG